MIGIVYGMQMEAEGKRVGARNSFRSSRVGNLVFSASGGQE